MPGYKGHLARGVLAFAATYTCLKHFCPTTTVAFHWFCATLAGSLFPDIDVKSKGQKYFYWILLFIFIILIVESRLDILALVALISVAPMLVRHRGIFHRPWFIISTAMVFWAIISSFHPQWGQPLFFIQLFFVSGALSHLWLDFGLVRMMQLFKAKI